jgi:L-threonylcarbamoyladenylate synthase
VSQVFEIDLGHPDGAGPALEAAARAIESGMLVVLPTETVYGIACRPDRPEATGRLFAAKRRPTDVSLPVLAPSAESAWEAARPNEAAVALAASFWPGPLTMILPRADRSRHWSLGTSTDSIAVRVPHHALCFELMKRSGHLAATSANLSGLPPASTQADLLEAFGNDVAVYLVLGSGAVSPAGVASTVVDLTNGSPRILRQGPVPPEDLVRVAGDGPGLEPSPGGNE